MATTRPAPDAQPPSQPTHPLQRRRLPDLKLAIYDGMTACPVLPKVKAYTGTVSMKLTVLSVAMVGSDSQGDLALQSSPAWLV